MSNICIVYRTENCVRPFNYLELKLECLGLFYVLAIFRKSCFRKCLKCSWEDKKRGKTALKRQQAVCRQFLELWGVVKGLVRDYVML